MFYALAHREEDFLVDNLYKFVAFAPCTICPEDGDESWWEYNLFNFPDYGIYNLYGPGWTKNHLKICAEWSQETCDYYTCDWCQPMSVHSETHWW